MRIAIIVLTFNRKEYCQKTLDHLISHDHGGHAVDVYVHDNASSDGTPEMLKEYDARHENFTISLGEENCGTAGGFQHLLNMVFDKGYDFIVKNDDDEYFPDDWTDILQYWGALEARGVLLVGFKRKCTRYYFEEFNWVGRYPENKEPVRYGENICYRSYITPGPMICTEAGWRALYPALSDFGENFGGWDAAIAMKIKRLGKQCCIVFNRECIHFQRWEDHPEYTKSKLEQMDRVRDRIHELRAEGKL